MNDERAGGYAVICLPVIEWNSRFQRPQQLMKQCAEQGHEVYYAALRFNNKTDARLTPLHESVYEMELPGDPGKSVYKHLPSRDDVDKMCAAIDRMRRERRITSSAVVVQLPFWTALAERLREKFGWPIVYDCMDDHSGFSTNCAAMLRMEKRLAAEADLVVTTSATLDEKVRPKARRTALIRNACDYEHFAACMNDSRVLTTTGPHPNPLPRGEGTLPPSVRTIGFYGAIAEWFDAELVADLAESRPQWRFKLIGSTFTGDVSRLKTMSNVELLGEKPYAELPSLVADWDAFIVPFRRIPLTEATNPVKAYEMLATGKPVVAVDLPELRPMALDGLLSLADDARGFAEAIERELAEDCEQRRQLRRQYAAGNTWKDRFVALDAAIRELYPPVSIVVVTYNNIHLNQECLKSIYQNTDWPNYEVIVVDNASTDGTAEWLAELEGDTAASFLRPAGGYDGPSFQPKLKVILNDDNRGFSGGNNQGMRAASGEFLCLLNNDTVVTRGWISTLVGHLRDMPQVGIIGPVSNQVGNEAKVEVAYESLEEMPGWAERYCQQNDGVTVPIDMLGFFCVVFQRDLYEIVGELDERFGIGCFEDDDYCKRAKQDGYELRFARDAFVHHWQEASFRLLGKQRYLDIYYENQRRYSEKWTAGTAAGVN